MRQKVFQPLFAFILKPYEKSKKNVAAQTEQPRRKVDHIAGGPAAKAVEIIPVQLHAGMPVIVEGAADHVAPVDLAAVVLGGLLHSNSRFYSFKQIHRLCPPSFIDGICPSA